MSWSYRPALDGLRSIAVYLVLLFHTGLPWVSGGFIGVDLFFVLSGFLVTNVILSEIDTTGRLHVGKFYTRRVRRLLPAALVVIVATSLIYVLISTVVQRVSLVSDAQSALLYLANWHFLGQSNDYFAQASQDSPYLHYWSLAIEEQFYLIFPLLILAVVALTKRRTSPLIWVLGVLFTLSLGSQVYWSSVDVSHAYYGTDARLYQLLAGALLALALRSVQVRKLRRWGVLATNVGLAMVLVFGTGLIDASPSIRGMAATLASCLLISGLTLSEKGLIARALARPVPVYLGKISYGTYLWHWPVILFLRAVLTTTPVVIAVISAAVATGLAAVSYQVLEMPIRKGAFLNRFNWTPAVVGVTASAIVAITVIPLVLHSDRRPALAQVSFTSSRQPAGGEHGVQVPDNVDWSKVKDDVGEQHTCPADDVEACQVVSGSGPHVLLVGDSQAQMLVPMFEKLARDHDFTLSLNVRAGCMWQEGLVNLEASEPSREVCASVRDGWYEKALPAMRPDIVILVQRARDDPQKWGDKVLAADGSTAPLDELTLEATDQTISTIESFVPDSIIVENLVMPETFEPNDCLASASDAAQCSVPVPLSVTPSDGYYLAADARSPSVHAVNLNSAFCPSAPLCQAVVGDRIVWRDDHHYTADYATSRSEQVWHLLQQSGAMDASN